MRLSQLKQRLATRVGRLNVKSMTSAGGEGPLYEGQIGTCHGYEHLAPASSGVAATMFTIPHFSENLGKATKMASKQVDHHSFN